MFWIILIVICFNSWIFLVLALISFSIERLIIMIYIIGNVRSSEITWRRWLISWITLLIYILSCLILFTRYSLKSNQLRFFGWIQIKTLRTKHFNLLSWYLIIVGEYFFNSLFNIWYIFARAVFLAHLINNCVALF